MPPVDRRREEFKVRGEKAAQLRAMIVYCHFRLELL